MARYCPEYYSPDEVFPTEAQVESGVVFGPEGDDYTGTLVATSGPSAPNLSVIEVSCLDGDYAAEEGVDIDFRIVTVPEGDSDRAFRSTKTTVTSNSSGVARYEAPYGSIIEYKRGSATVWESAIVQSAATTSIGSFIGAP